MLRAPSSSRNCATYLQVWKEKYATAEGNVFHRQREWRVEYDQKMKNEADKLLRTVCRFFIWTNADAAIAEILKFKRYLSDLMAISKDSIINLPFANLVSACSVKQPVLDLMANITSWALSENEKSVGNLILPQFAYKKSSNAIWLAQKNVLDAFVKGNVSIDTDYQIIFKDQVDARDERPMVYSCKLIFPGHLDPRKTMWKNSQLYRMRRTDEVAQLASRDMLVIEDVSDTALPNSTDDAGVLVQGAAKFEQLGRGAFECIISGLMDNVELPHRGAYLFIDQRVKAANLLMAILSKRGGSMYEDEGPNGLAIRECMHAVCKSECPWALMDIGLLPV